LAAEVTVRIAKVLCKWQVQLIDATHYSKQIK